VKWLKAKCPKCQGTLVLEEDERKDQYIKCMQCGSMQDLQAQSMGELERDIGPSKSGRAPVYRNLPYMRR
jgi:DNA-directed RNA polymerase subunit M/transcription elongation factor TFIIS